MVPHPPHPADLADHHRGVELLERSLGWTRVRLAGITEDDLDRPTPCAGWDLAALLAHMGDSLDAFLEAATGAVEVTMAPSGITAAGARETLTAKACTLLGAWTHAEPGDVELGPTRMGTGLMTAAAALEIAVHGWDVGRAVGHPDRLPETLARALLPTARALVTPPDRGVRFAAALPTAPDAPYDVALLGLLGRGSGPCDPNPGSTGTNSRKRGTGRAWGS
ncbi:TIGR03086 family metal-binding protein [Nocardioides pacificus]